MAQEKSATQQAILAAAQAEFWEKGFQRAALHSIVKAAGVTTGALYGYYGSKEALFEALVGRQYKYIMSRYRKAQENFTRIPPAKQPDHMGDISAQCMMDLLLYAYDHLKACQLLLCRAEGTRFAHMVDEMVAIEVQGTHEYLQVLSQLGRSAPAIDPKLEHILITGMFNAYFELVLHKMPLEQAKAYLNELHVFYAAGWMKIMGQCPHNFSRIS